MALSILFFPILVGYWFLRHFNGTKYDIYRSSGYHVLFTSAIAGSLLLAVAYCVSVFSLLIFLFIFPHFGENVVNLWKSYVPFNYSGTIVLSAIIGFVSPYLLNKRYNEDEMARKTAKEKGNLKELLLRESIDRKAMVELSLQSGKVYIGFVSEIGIDDGTDVALIPVVSGYRKEETRELKITTEYTFVRNVFSLDDDVFQIVFKMSEIVTARIFDPDVYELFKTLKDECDGSDVGE